MKEVRDAGLKRWGKCGSGSIPPPPLLPSAFPDLIHSLGRRSTIEVTKNNKPEHESNE